jgi:hypothetical protein
MDIIDFERILNHKIHLKQLFIFIIILKILYWQLFKLIIEFKTALDMLLPPSNPLQIKTRDGALTQSGSKKDVTPLLRNAIPSIR